MDPCGFICVDSNFCILYKYSFGRNLTLKRRKQTIKHTTLFSLLRRIRWCMSIFDLIPTWFRRASSVSRNILDVLHQLLAFFTKPTPFSSVSSLCCVYPSLDCLIVKLQKACLPTSVSFKAFHGDKLNNNKNKSVVESSTCHAG